MTEQFHGFATNVSRWMGSAKTFAAAVLIVVLWAFFGPAFNYSDSWQLFINTGTTIVTFLMVFLIQNTQNRDARAMQLKLDELIRATKAARNQLIDLEDLSEKELDELHQEFSRLHKETEMKLKKIRAGKKR